MSSAASAKCERSSDPSFDATNGDAFKMRRARLKSAKLLPADYWKSMLVSVECGEGGFFQGVVDAVDSNAQTVTLVKAFVNGKPKEDDGGKLVLAARMIDCVKILGLPEDTAPEEMSVVEEPRRRSANFRNNLHNRANNAGNGGVAHQLLNHHQNRNRTGVSADTRHSPSKPLICGSPRNNVDEDGSQRKDDWKRRMMAKDDACFGTSVDCFIDEEFDFEKNLALFDKRAVFQEITANQKNEPVKRKLYYRHDESVLRTTSQDNYRGISGASNNQKISGAQKSAFSKPEPSRRSKKKESS